MSGIAYRKTRFLISASFYGPPLVRDCIAFHLLPRYRAIVSRVQAPPRSELGPGYLLYPPPLVRDCIAFHLLSAIASRSTCHPGKEGSALRLEDDPPAGVRLHRVPPAGARLHRVPPATPVKRVRPSGS
jgi:hypothetical protein